MKTRLNHGFSVVFFSILFMMTGAFFSYAAADTDSQAVSVQAENEHPDSQEAITKTSSRPTGPAGDTLVIEEPVYSYLGNFMTTAYCSCTKCSGGSNKTFAGTVPKANHTISANLNLYPLGTKLKIGDIIYTVEDTGSNIGGDMFDIFFDSHQAALNYGMQNADVYIVK